MPETKTKEGWTHALREPGRQFTLQEFTALCLVDSLSYQTQTFHANEHVEGMLGAIDLFASYLAQKMGVPYAESQTIRAALDAQRDEYRRVADEYRKKSLGITTEESSPEKQTEPSPV